MRNLHKGNMVLALMSLIEQKFLCLALNNFYVIIMNKWPDKDPIRYV